MKSTNMTSSALLSAMVVAASFASIQAAKAQNEPKEKCFGIAEAGQNDCASVIGSHACAGMSKAAAYDGQEWKQVPKGTCIQMKGSLKPFEGTNPKIKR